MVAKGTAPGAGDGLSRVCAAEKRCRAACLPLIQARLWQCCKLDEVGTAVHACAAGTCTDGTWVMCVHVVCAAARGKDEAAC